MTKVGINVGEDFPAEEVAEPERPHEDDICRDREEWRAKARAFKEDVRRAARKHFGDHAFTAHNGFMLRVLLGVTLIALAIAILPHVLLLAILAGGIVFYMARHGHFAHHHHYDAPRGDI